MLAPLRAAGALRLRARPAAKNGHSTTLRAPRARGSQPRAPRHGSLSSRPLTTFATRGRRSPDPAHADARGLRRYAPRSRFYRGPLHCPLNRIAYACRSSIEVPAVVGRRLALTHDSLLVANKNTERASSILPGVDRPTRAKSNLRREYDLAPCRDSSMQLLHLALHGLGWGRRREP